MSPFSAVTRLISCDPDLQLLLNTIQKSGDDYWLVGGCLRNAFLDIPQIDIDIATAVDPTALAQNWATTVGGKWFWLDVNRKQSRVILRHGLTVDFAPLRAPSIIADLQLRDFTVNALALLLDDSFLEADIIDPLGGINHLQNRKLITCSTQSFNADPLRMLKGIRHAVSLNFTLAVATQEQIKESAHLLIASAGERIRTELAKIFTAQNVGRGISLLLDTGIWDVIAGSTGSSWDKTTTIDGIENLRNKILEKGLVVPANQTDSVSPDQFSLPAIFLFARLFKLYCPNDLSSLLHDKLRFSRYQQGQIEALQVEIDPEWLSLAASVEGRRSQALLVEHLGHFAVEKLLNWGVYRDLLSLIRVGQLQDSFVAEQKLGRISDLLSGKLLDEILGASRYKEIGEWQTKIKLAEVRGEVATAAAAQRWLKANLSFDNK